MELWQRLERIIPTGKNAADVAAMRTKVEETTGDECSMTHMALYRFYDDKAREQKLLSPLLHFVANRHLREARRSAKYYPDPLELHVSLLAKEGDLGKSAQEYEDIIPRQRAWIKVFGDPDGSRKLQLCVDISTAGAARSVLGQFTEALFWNMEAWKEFNELPADVRASHAVLEDRILGGIVRSLLARFRYEDALAFIEQVLEGEVLSERALPRPSAS